MISTLLNDNLRHVFSSTQPPSIWWTFISLSNSNLRLHTCWCNASCIADSLTVSDTIHYTIVSPKVGPEIHWIILFTLISRQKRIVRILSISKYNAHTDPLFKTNKLLKVQDIFKLQELKFYFKFKNNKLPYYLQNLPFNRNTTHSHATRSQHNIHQMRPNHEYARKCIWYDLLILINNAPIQIIEKGYTHSLHSFAAYIKLKILESYQEHCRIVNCYICWRK